MHFGVVLPNAGPGAGRLALVDTALSAERLGFQSVWVNDPLGEAAPGGSFEPQATLAYLAAITQRLRLGFSALALPLRNPLEVGRQLATLDLLSNGRVWVALGLGRSANAYDHLGQNFQDRGQRLTEAIRVLRTLWRGNPVVSFRGKFYNFQKVAFAPPCVQYGGPPLWVAGNSAAALRRAVLHADGWHPAGLSADEMAQALAPVRGLLNERPFEVVIRLPIRFSGSPQPGALYGSPTEIIAQLQAYRRFGLTGVVLECPVESQAERERTLERCAAEVLPALA